MTTKPKNSQYKITIISRVYLRTLFFGSWFFVFFHSNVNTYGRLIECLKGTTSNQM